MAKISLDVKEIKKNLTEQALNATAHLTEIATKAQKDLEEKEVYKKAQAVFEKVKTHEFTQEIMKNPRVIELKRRLTAASEQLEKTITKNAGPLIEEVKARFAAQTEKADKMAKDAVKETKEGVQSTVKKAKKAASTTHD